MADAVLNLDEVMAELEAMSDEELRKSLLEMKVKEKVNTKKYYNADTAKKQRQKLAAKKKAMTEIARQRGFYDEINERAGVLASEKLAEETGEGDDD